MSQEIKKIKETSLAVIMALMYWFFSMLVTVSLSIGGTIDLFLRVDPTEPRVVMLLSNFAISILISTLVSISIGVIGWAEGYVLAMFYNKFAKRFGGIRVESKEIEE